MFLMIDNYDSFVYNLVRYFKELNQDIKVVRRDKIDFNLIDEKNIEGIIISPGPKSPNETLECIQIINTFKNKIPILGVCLGHQCIGYYFGANIVKGKFPMHGKISSIETDQKGLFKGIPKKFNVTRYHSLIIDRETLPTELEITALSEDGVIMGVRHREYKIEAIQFHPEAVITEFGHEIIDNFINMCKEN